MSLRFFVVHEAAADFTMATEIADRVLTAEIEWLDDTPIDGVGKTVLDTLREWIGEHPSGEPLIWTSIPDRARELGIRVRGHFNGEPGLEDAKAARRAIAYLLRLDETVDAILLIRDMDNKADRRRGLDQARTYFDSRTRVVIGLAIPERECWVLSGFDPKDEAEGAKLKEEIQNLGFDPCRKSHQLTACNDDQAKRSPKRVHKELIRQDLDRERECWQVTTLSMLKERGADNGLRAYLKEVADRLVPLITGHEGKPRNSTIS